MHKIYVRVIYHLSFSRTLCSFSKAGMVNYGSVEYWNDRYAGEEDNPFDWLFDFSDVSQIIKTLIEDQNSRILLPGCGNAPFSPDLFEAGYQNQDNIDISDVVITYMSKKYPKIRWNVMDALKMDYPDCTFPFIIDKSLIDTLLCYNDSINNTNKMLQELYRVLEHGGRCISFSLHGLEEASNCYLRCGLNWRVQSFRVKSSRWNEAKNRRRAVAHTLIICDKPLETGEFKYPEILNLEGALSENEYQALERHAVEVNEKTAFQLASVEDLMKCLNAALQLWETQHDPTKLELETESSHSPIEVANTS